MAANNEGQMNERAILQLYLEQISAARTADRKKEFHEKAGYVANTVLVVDDDYALRNLMSKWLQMQGFRTLAAGSGAEALHVAERHAGRIDALVTDIDLPNFDGIELALRLKAIRPHVKVLFMSGSIFSALDAPFPGSSFVQKPFSLGLLRRKLRETLDSKDQERVVAQEGLIATQG